MIRLGDKKKRIFLALFVFIEIGLIVGAQAVKYYTKARMGMHRHVVYLNGKWEKKFPIEILKLFALALLVILIIYAISNYIKKKKYSQAKLIGLLITIGISGGSIFYILTNNVENTKPYYMVAILYFLLSIFQNINYHLYSSIKIKE